MGECSVSFCKKKLTQVPVHGNTLTSTLLKPNMTVSSGLCLRLLMYSLNAFINAASFVIYLIILFLCVGRVPETEIIGSCKLRDIGARN